MMKISSRGQKSISFTVVIHLLTSTGMVAGGSQLLEKLFSGYDNAVRPNFDEGIPVTILVSMYVEAFGNIQEANMEYLVYGYFQQRWKDPRLAGKLNYTLILKGGDIKNMWLPDPYCYNARESNMMIEDTQLHSKISVDPNGEIFYSRGVTLLASCIMDLRHFPMDSQNCNLKFGSYGYTTDDIIFEWKTTTVTVGNSEMAQFQYNSNKVTSDVDEFSSGNFSTVTVTFLFERRMGYYFIQVYLPDIFVVVLSWIVFWMDITEMGDRMALGITCILTIMFLLGSLNGSLPRVSYAKALDWYLLVSFIFVFLSLIECMLVFIINVNCSKRGKSAKQKSNALQLLRVSKVSSHEVRPPVNSQSNGSGIKETTMDGKVKVDCQNESRTWPLVDAVVPGGHENIGSNSVRTSGCSVDKACRVFFPTLFVIFNIVYWVAYALPE